MEIALGLGPRAAPVVRRLLEGGAEPFALGTQQQSLFELAQRLGFPEELMSYWGELIKRGAQ